MRYILENCLVHRRRNNVVQPYFADEKIARDGELPSLNETYLVNDRARSSTSVF